MLLLGKEVADSLCKSLKRRVSALTEKGIQPKLVILRLGENPGDISYERGAMRRGQETGVAVETVELPENTPKNQLLTVLDGLNQDSTVHGVLLLRPLPSALRPDQEEICNRLLPEKDVDGMTRLSAAGVFAGGQSVGYPPCTAAACMEILDHYQIPCQGAAVVVIGRSMVVGKPAAMMLLGKNATVTVCHTKTKNLPALCRQADILLSSAGVLGSLNKEFVRPGQVVLDVSINWDEHKPNSKGGLGAIAGDAVFDEVAPIVSAITPVPGGVGSVTSTVLMKHTVEAAEKTLL